MRGGGEDRLDGRAVRSAVGVGVGAHCATSGFVAAPTAQWACSERDSPHWNGRPMRHPLRCWCLARPSNGMRGSEAVSG